MSLIVARILMTAFAAMSWGLFGCLIAHGIQRRRGLDRLPVWLIVGGALAGAIVAFVVGPPAALFPE